MGSSHQKINFWSLCGKLEALCSSMMLFLRDSPLRSILKEIRGWIWGQKIHKRWTYLRVPGYLHERKGNLDSTSRILSHCDTGDWFKKATPLHSSSLISSICFDIWLDDSLDAVSIWRQRFTLLFIISSGSTLYF